jgi:hypothetical protein
MSPTLEQRTAPDTASGAVPFHPRIPVADPVTTRPLSEREFWVAVCATVLATLRPWSR